ncbi:peptidoglycan editing factor PgeF [Nocardioides montaniterrae]
MFAFRATVDPGTREGARVDVAFSDASLDLQEGGDAFDTGVAALVAEIGVPLARLTQVHGADVITLEDTPEGNRGDADALVTDRPGVALMIRVADCIPVLLGDADAGVIGAAHAGRRGVELDVVTRTVERMRALGATDIRAWIGPHICGHCYEVPEAMRDEVAALVPQTRAETSWGTPALDLGAGVAAQLAALGIEAEQVPGCTLEDTRLHSFRRDGAAAGRFAGLVWIP